MCHQMYGVSCIIEKLHTGRTHLARRSVEEPPIPRHVQSPHLTPIASQTQWPASYWPASFSTHGTGFKLSSFCTAAGSSHWQGRAWKPTASAQLRRTGRPRYRHPLSLALSLNPPILLLSRLPFTAVHLARAGRDCGGTAGVTCPAAVDGGKGRRRRREGSTGRSLIPISTTISD